MGQLLSCTGDAGAAGQKLPGVELVYGIMDNHPKHGLITKNPSSAAPSLNNSWDTMPLCKKLPIFSLQKILIKHDRQLAINKSVIHEVVQSLGTGGTLVPQQFATAHGAHRPAASSTARSTVSSISSIYLPGHTLSVLHCFIFCRFSLI